MIPIICFVGTSDSGKTTFLEKLIPVLRGRGYATGTVKHDVHGFHMDHEGKDTWRHRHAGARTAGILSPWGMASVRETSGEMDLARFVGKTFWDEDLVLAEGFRASPYPKIEIFRSALGGQPLCGPKENLVALVSDDAVDAQVPVFAFEAVEKVADFIEEKYLRTRAVSDVQVFFDGRKVPMNDFVESIIAGALKGMLSALRGWKSPGTVDISMRLREK